MDIWDCLMHMLVGPTQHMHAAQLLCTSRSQTAAAHALKQASRCEQPIVQNSAALRLTSLLQR